MHYSCQYRIDLYLWAKTNGFSDFYRYGNKLIKYRRLSTWLRLGSPAAEEWGDRTERIYSTGLKPDTAGRFGFYQAQRGIRRFQQNRVHPFSNICLLPEELGEGRIPCDIAAPQCGPYGITLPPQHYRRICPVAFSNTPAFQCTQGERVASWHNNCLFT